MVRCWLGLNRRKLKTAYLRAGGSDIALRRHIDRVALHAVPERVLGRDHIGARGPFSEGKLIYVDFSDVDLALVVQDRAAEPGRALRRQNDPGQAALAAAPLLRPLQRA